jgi:hypothetical protein
LIVLEVILIIVIVFYLLGLIARIWFKSYIQRLQKKMEQQQRVYEDSRKPEGQVTIQFDKKNQNKNSASDEGEYVDFEEIN